MGHPHARRFPSALQATALAISLLVGGAACGWTPPRPPGRATPWTGAVRPERRAGDDPRRSPGAGVRPGRGRVGGCGRWRRRSRAGSARTAWTRVPARRSPTVRTWSQSRWRPRSRRWAAAAVLHRARTGRALARRGGCCARTGDDLLAHSPTTEKHVGDGLSVARLCAAAITKATTPRPTCCSGRSAARPADRGLSPARSDATTRLDRREPSSTARPATARHHDPRGDGPRPARAVLGDTSSPRPRAPARLAARHQTGAHASAPACRDWTIGDKTGSGRPTAPPATSPSLARRCDAAPLVMANLHHPPLRRRPGRRAGHRRHRNGPRPRPRHPPLASGTARVRLVCGAWRAETRNRSAPASTESGYARSELTAQGPIARVQSGTASRGTAPALGVQGSAPRLSSVRCPGAVTRRPGERRPGRRAPGRSPGRGSPTAGSARTPPP